MPQLTPAEVAALLSGKPVDPKPTPTDPKPVVSQPSGRGVAPSPNKLVATPQAAKPAEAKPAVEGLSPTRTILAAIPRVAGPYVGSVIGAGLGAAATAPSGPGAVGGALYGGMTGGAIGGAGGEYLAQFIEQAGRQPLDFSHKRAAAGALTGAPPGAATIRNSKALSAALGAGQAVAGNQAYKVADGKPIAEAVDPRTWDYSDLIAGATGGTVNFALSSQLGKRPPAPPNETDRPRFTGDMAWRPPVSSVPKEPHTTPDQMNETTGSMEKVFGDLGKSEGRRMSKEAKTSLATGVSDTRGTSTAPTQPTGVKRVVLGEKPGQRFAVADPEATSASPRGYKSPKVEAPTAATEAALAKPANPRMGPAKITAERTASKQAARTEQSADLQIVKAEQKSGAQAATAKVKAQTKLAESADAHRKRIAKAQEKAAIDYAKINKDAAARLRIKKAMQTGELEKGPDTVTLTSTADTKTGKATLRETFGPPRGDEGPDGPGQGGNAPKKAKVPVSPKEAKALGIPALPPKNLPPDGSVAPTPVKPVSNKSEALAQADEKLIESRIAERERSGYTVPDNPVAQKLEAERLAIEQGKTLPKATASDKPLPKKAVKAAEDEAVENEIIGDLVEKAKRGGFVGSEPDLRKDLGEKLSFLKEWDKEFAELGKNPQVLLKAIAKRGGISINKETGLKGEIKWLKEHREQTAASRRVKGPDGKTRNEVVKGRNPHTTDRMGGVVGVFRDKDGMSLDDMLTSLKQDKEFSHLNTIDDLVNEVRKGAMTKVDTRHVAQKLADSLGDQWWSKRGIKAPVEDIIESTGEAQPRLPEAGKVRDASVETPKVAEVPFSLSPEVAKTKTLPQPDMFAAPPAATADDVAKKAPKKVKNVTKSAPSKDPAEVERALGVTAGNAPKKGKGLRISKPEGMVIERNETQPGGWKRTEFPPKVEPEPADIKTQLKDSLKKLGKDESGRIDSRLLTNLTTTGIGALAGSAMNDEDPMGGALLGGIAGFGAGKGIQALGRRGVGTGKGGDVIKGLVERLPNYQRAALLSGFPNLAYNSVAGPWGANFFGSLENAIGGNRQAGVRALGETLHLPRWGKNYIKNLGKAADVIQESERSGATPLSDPTFVDKYIIGAPANLMTAGDLTSRDLFMRSGFSEKAAREMTLTSEPKLPFTRTLAHIGKEKDEFGNADYITQLLLPFKRTAANILERGAERMPGLGAYVNRWRKAHAPEDVIPDLQSFVQQGIGFGVGLASYQIGAMTPEGTAKSMKLQNLVSNISGPYAGVAGVFFSMGQAARRGNDISNAAVAGVERAVPLPTLDLARDAAKTYDSWQDGKLDAKDLPRTLVPQLFTSIKELNK